MGPLGRKALESVTIIDPRSRLIGSDLIRIIVAACGYQRPAFTVSSISSKSDMHTIRGTYGHDRIYLKIKTKEEQKVLAP
jgi:hypothetical protein